MTRRSRRPHNASLPWLHAGAAMIVCFHFLTAAVPARTPAQDPLPSTTLRIGAATVVAEIADESDERTTGLMGRQELADGKGMLFVFHQPRPMNFYMRDTLIPLSIAYINAAGIIREIHDLEPLNEAPVRSTFPDLLYALEVPQGWFLRNNILPGDRILGLPAPSTSEPD
jgi:uncharacterized membrane protein (UPF0127 family)